MGFYAALLFLTRIPFPQVMLDEKKIASSVPFFPLAGSVIGGISSIIYFLGRKYLPLQVLSVIIIAGWAMVTGGMHIDGFADTLDGIFCGGSRDKKLSVMKDSRIGAYGAMGVVLLLLFKFSLITALSQQFIIPALILAPALSRWSVTYAIVLLPYGRESGLGKAFSMYKSPWQFVFSSILAIGIAAVLANSRGIILLLILFLASFFISKYIISQIGGHTGDTYGALNEICEVIVLLFFVILSNK
ncbi:MAG: adenosylcobinamide-GDP ribazoletransferase [Tepidanaerobacteraceae bacterium]|jgi:adenosylcobinamide-GDP ribazoletransferase|nr:adenosylcobinamide-GDP ribazoletransferase [Tepidanaerobacteraceae bacterium]